MRRDGELRANHEQAVAERFIQRYNEEKNTEFVFQRRLSPPAPDFEYVDSTSGETIGIEVTGVYYDEHAAEGIWQVARGNIEQYQSNIYCEPTKHLQQFIEGRIAGKCQKTYDFDHPIILVLDITAALHDERDIEEIEAMARQVKLPEQISFHEVYFGMGLGQYKIWKLYPRKQD